MKKISLVQLKNNQKSIVVEITAGHALQARLMSMGIYKGSTITKLSQFMLRGPVAVKVGRSIIALGYGMATKVMVEIE
ncbi:MAG: ferrous iron transport protein A [Candidatus Omnitrophica bacterium]|nr:ferrous iron transport protein A [Candidatus Omnitrophota bacterium]